MSNPGAPTPASITDQIARCHRLMSDLERRQQGMETALTGLLPEDQPQTVWKESSGLVESASQLAERIETALKIAQRHLEMVSPDRENQVPSMTDCDIEKDWGYRVAKQNTHGTPRDFIR